MEVKGLYPAAQNNSAITCDPRQRILEDVTMQHEIWTAKSTRKTRASFRSYLRAVGSRQVRFGLSQGITAHVADKSYARYGHKLGHGLYPRCGCAEVVNLARLDIEKMYIGVM